MSQAFCLYIYIYCAIHWQGRIVYLQIKGTMYLFITYLFPPSHLPHIALFYYVVKVASTSSDTAHELYLSILKAHFSDIMYYCVAKLFCQEKQIISQDQAHRIEQWMQHDNRYFPLKVVCLQLYIIFNAQCTLSMNVFYSIFGNGPNAENVITAWTLIQQHMDASNIS